MLFTIYVDDTRTFDLHFYYESTTSSRKTVGTMATLPIRVVCVMSISYFVASKEDLKVSLPLLGLKLVEAVK